MDLSTGNKLYGDINYDISSMISDLELELKDGSISVFREDTFKNGFENIFNVPIDDIDDIEAQLQTESNSEEKIEIYKDLVLTIRGFFDTYFGITFDERSGEVIDLNKLYMLYRVLYLNYIEFLSRCVYGRCRIENLSTDFINQRFVEETIEDENIFTSDNIQLWLNDADPGNEEYIYIFGSPETDEDDSENVDNTPEVCIDNFAFKARINKDFLDSGNDENFAEIISTRAKSMYK